MGQVGRPVFPGDQVFQCPETLIPLRVSDLISVDRIPTAPHTPVSPEPVVVAVKTPAPELASVLAHQERRIADLERRIARGRVAVAVSLVGLGGMGLLLGASAVGVLALIAVV